jgi:hypothetical protein
MRGSKTCSVKTATDAALFWETVVLPSTPSSGQRSIEVSRRNPNTPWIWLLRSRVPLLLEGKKPTTSL